MAKKKPAKKAPKAKTPEAPQPAKKPRKTAKTGSGVGNKGMPALPRDSNLPDAHLAFVNEYFRDFNGAAAVIRAGYAPENAYAQSRVLLHNPLVRNEIRRRMALICVRTGITAERVLKEIGLVAFSNIYNYATVQQVPIVDEEGKRIGSKRVVKIDRSLYNEDGTMKPYELGAAVQELSQDRHGIKIKLHNKLDALEKLCKHLNIFKELPPIEIFLNLFPENLRDRILMLMTASGMQQPPIQTIEAPKEVHAIESNGKAH